MVKRGVSEFNRGGTRTNDDPPWMSRGSEKTCNNRENPENSARRAQIKIAEIIKVSK